MVVGVGKEVKTDESRVGLLPEQSEILRNSGHKVIVEKGAGEKAGFPDKSYSAKGADIVSKEYLYKNAEMVLKVKCPLESEYGYLQNGQIIYTFLHFDENISPENIQRMVSRGITGIAYEWVEENGDYPLLRPMSEITGILFALQSMRILVEKRGVLPGGFLKGITPPTAMVIGMGRIGTNALKVFLMNNLDTVVFDKYTENIEERALRYIDKKLWHDTRHKRKIICFEEAFPEKSAMQVENLLEGCDILLNCAVRSPGLPRSKMKHLVTRKMVSKMKKGSVICDATACDKDMVETAVSSEKLDKVYEEEGVYHYNCDHIPALVPNTASRLLSESNFPYIRILADRGFEKAVREKEALFKGVMCHGGHLTHKYTSEKKLMPWRSLKGLLETANL